MHSYLKLCTEFYDIDKPTAPPETLAFYLHYAERARGPILEPMCGSGRYLIPLKQRGFDIEGMDASPHMLDACRERCASLGLSPSLHQQYMHELSLPRQFALAFIPDGSWSLIGDLEQVKESLRRIHAMLLPGAKFVFETSGKKPEKSFSWPWGGRWVRRADGAKIVISWLGHYDASTSMSHDIHRYDLIHNGALLASEFEEFDRRHYTLDEMCALLEEAGFTQFKAFKVHARREPDEADEDIIIECSKR
jgi:SAM-dependent methyltransferase